MLQDQANVSIWHTALQFLRNFAALALAVNEKSPINLFIMPNITPHTGAFDFVAAVPVVGGGTGEAFFTGLRFRKKENRYSDSFLHVFVFFGWRLVPVPLCTAGSAAAAAAAATSAAPSHYKKTAS